MFGTKPYVGAQNVAMVDSAAGANNISRKLQTFLYVIEIEVFSTFFFGSSYFSVN